MAIKGIDVSVWQGAIDFNAVRNSGVDFVIIRAGYGTNSKDKYFEENYRKAKAAGLHVGAYWYSYADSFSEAAQEAEMCRDLEFHVAHAKIPCRNQRCEPVAASSPSPERKIQKRSPASSSTRK